MPQEKNINLYQIAHSLRGFSKEELKSFGKWLRSPWCNSNKVLITLFDFLKKYHPDFEHPTLMKEKIFAKVYPEKKYNDRWLRNLLSALNKQTDKFLIHQRVNSEKDLSTLLLAKEQIERNQPKRLAKLVAQRNRIYEKTNNLSLEQLFISHFVNDLLYFETGQSVHNQFPKSPLHTANELLDQYFLSAKWRYLNSFEERRRLFKSEEQPNIKFEIIEQLSEDHSIPVIELYQYKLRHPKEFSEEQFEQLKERYFDSYNDLPLQDRKLFYFSLLNHLIQLTRSGTLSIFEKVFSFYLYGIDKKLLFSNNQLSPNTYTNIVTTGNIIKDFEATNTFIQQHTQHLSLEQQQDAETWALANLNFKQGDLLKATELLRAHKFKIHTFDIQTRFLLQQLYLSLLKEQDSYLFLFLDYSKAYQKFIHRDKKLSKNRKKSYLAFIKFCLSVGDVLAKGNQSRKELESILIQLNKEKNISGKNWLADFIADLF